MRPIVPYALLGAIGAVGLFFGSHTSSAVDGADTVAPARGVVRLEAGLERTKLIAGGPRDVFARVALEGVRPAQAKKERVPVSLALVIDRSGSMEGAKMDMAKRAARDAIGALEAGDRFVVVTFDTGAEVLGSGAASDPVAVERTLTAIDGIFARGGTDMIAGLRLGGEEASRIGGPGRVNRLLLLSDGHPNTTVGLADDVTATRAAGIATTTIGVGVGYNEDLMAALADKGGGRYHFVDKPEVLASIFAEELRSIASVVAREARVALRPGPGVQVREVVGFDTTREGDATLIAAGDVYGGRTTDVLVRLSVDPSARDAKRPLLDVELTYQDVAAGIVGREARALDASIVANAQESEASTVTPVMVKAEKWRTADAYARANDAYNRGDVAAGDAILTEQTQRLTTQATAFRSPDLAKEATELERFQRTNAVGGASTRSVLNKEAKRKAWTLNKGSAYR